MVWADFAAQVGLAVRSGLAVRVGPAARTVFAVWLGSAVCVGSVAFVVDSSHLAADTASLDHIEAVEIADMVDGTGTQPVLNVEEAEAVGDEIAGLDGVEQCRFEHEDPVLLVGNIVVAIEGAEVALLLDVVVDVMIDVVSTLLGWIEKHIAENPGSRQDCHSVAAADCTPFHRSRQQWLTPTPL